MNIFGFDTLQSVMALLGLCLVGLLFGFILGFTRYLLFAFMDKKADTWSNLGKEVKLHGEN
jgi:NhaP-type Na+/H+ or K+/H+ antiporter